MTNKERLIELLRKTPRADSIGTVNAAREFKKAHAAAAKKVAGRITESQVQAFINNLSRFY